MTDIIIGIDAGTSVIKSVAFLLEEGKNFSAARAILGDAQWATFEKGHTLGDLEGFFEALGDAIGANPTL